MERNNLLNFFVILISIFTLNQLQAAAYTKCIAHRGDNQHFLENSLDAIEAAYELGADGIEFDIHHTKDDVAIIMHDENLLRVTLSKPGKSCPLKEKISNLNYQAIKDNCILSNGEEIPTLESFLSYLQDKEIYTFLEFKDRPSKNTLELIEYYFEFAPELVTFISFDQKALELAYEKKIESKFWSKAKYLQLYKMMPKSKGPFGVNINHLFMGLLSRKHFKNGVGVWTVDKPNRMKDVFKKGIHYLTTNDPSTCIKLKNEWP